MKKRILGVCALLLSSLGLLAQRNHYVLDTGWMFRFSHQVEKNSPQAVSLPHTWNAQDALSGKMDYKRGIGNYERSLFIRPEWKNKRLFLRFEGVCNIADVFIDGQHVGEHRGGYSAFVFEITDWVKSGGEHKLWVRVNNAEQFDVMPLVGDFNMYGGIYRNVSLIVTDQACISLLDNASPGVYLTQKKVTSEQADVETRVLLSNSGKSGEAVVRLAVKEGTKVVFQEDRTLALPEKTAEVFIPFSLRKPHLWNGRQDPFMYQVEVTLLQQGQVLDRVEQPLGLRYYHVDPNQGFFLNGRHLALHGVCRHQDRAELGNALRSQHHVEDMNIMLEMGVNAMRLAHYQQAEDIYDLADEAGMIVWAEIPFVGPGGYADKGFINLPSLKENGRQQLKELIRQNYNHPSICVWGLFNELKEEGDNPVEYIEELHKLAKQEDVTRPTTAASNQSGAMNYFTDLIAWNRYDGWYGNTPKTLATFLDDTHARNPKLCIGISEYGAGASIYHQQDSLKQPAPAGYWHPENWQTYYHMENWKILSSRPFVWGSFVWNMFDFGAAHRHEGDRPGINDKGLVTFDRKVRKDAFYFYKANWNKDEPVLYLVGRRNVRRVRPVQDIQVFTNLSQVELKVNGISCGVKSPDAYCTVTWPEVALKSGENVIEVHSVKKKPELSDVMRIELVL
ncbi:glycosyl hydrolase family 2, sugar binding domain protein [gut metagenome]|uniref:Glycosyl hydrolase family 2, sugar binding domain protein n=1 Tax=gut metagenome TaxID=749906 RepID=J9H8C0_9ZZZZ